MKDKYVLTSIILFFIIQTSYFWEKWIGFLLFPITIIILIILIVLISNLIAKLLALLQSKFKNKEVLKSFIIQSIILTLIIFFPFGMIKFNNFEEKDVILAFREGVAGCGSHLKFKVDNTYIDKEICFGSFESSGKYQIKGDTILFLGESKNDYAVIKRGKVGNELVCFKNDSVRFIYEITKLELKQK